MSHSDSGGVAALATRADPEVVIKSTNSLDFYFQSVLKAPWASEATLSSMFSSGCCLEPPLQLQALQRKRSPF
ncbi:hypothetical protein EYF80_008088 [Liparis tanakae]|uniref:Uncharacterized protein n=1 Tax=Liparis tanakae TaxID=230148 RepID=A0A4Z2IWI5_9TELE|nr:hypothetical protein EYF80_008088 [Liparis tanakae]